MKLLRHFGFERNPFERSTPANALYRHRGFEEAHSRLLFTIELAGIAVLLAEPGCGKSLLLGVLADHLLRNGWVVHYFAHATVSPFGLVNVLARKVGLSPRRSRGETALQLCQHVAKDERPYLVIIDEAHKLPDATLEDIRLLTIGDFDRESPFLLLLAGQPLLDQRLAEPNHYALDQRITTAARLQPLSIDETRQYLKTRIEYAGAGDQPVFDDASIDALFDISGGIPRRINNSATASLIVAASRGRRIVSAQDVNDARLDRGRP
ncbi:MAG: AAA family ATPase [Proteobacteria bacterium]|nr:AAA family ATPase [Pseudomonadota bacterium]